MAVVVFSFAIVDPELKYLTFHPYWWGIVQR